jgi:hypothetical protein
MTTVWVSRETHDFVGKPPSKGRFLALVRNSASQRVDGIFSGKTYATGGFYITAMNERV